MLAHLILGVVFTFNLLGFIVLAPDRFALILRACLEWDRNTIFWFRNFGGYPRRFFKIPFGPVEVPPQGRYCLLYTSTSSSPFCRFLTRSSERQATISRLPRAAPSS